MYKRQTQRKTAIFADVALKEIVTTNKKRVDPLAPAGIAAAQLKPAQREKLMELVRLYIGRWRPELADETLAKITAAGLDKITFAWAGGLDRTKQTQGFRLTFHEALRAPVAVRWEIDRPAPRGRGRAVELGDAQARVGMRVFDQELMMKPGDPPGAWSVRVFVGDEVVVERRVEIYDPRTRRRDPVLSKRARP